MSIQNSFQAWAGNYARAFGFTVETCGNWVKLRKAGQSYECMSVQGVQELCACAAWLEVQS